MAPPTAARIPAPERWSLSTLLLLADGRFPAGGHAHSGGLEPAAAHAGVRDLASLEAFLRGRAATAGAVAAAAAAAACAALSDAAGSGDAGAALDRLDQEIEARMPSPALRAASRRLGRQLLRAGRVVWPDARLDALAAAMPRGPHQSAALGAVAAAAGLGPREAAAAAAYDAVAGPAMAAVRLLGLDPFAVHALLARLGPALDGVAATAAAQAHRPPTDLPAWSAPLLDLLAEQHTKWEVRLFGS